MIKCNLAVIMAERGLNITKLSKDTGISRNALSALYHNAGKGIQYETLDKLCDYFDVSVERLLTHFRAEFSISDVDWIDKDKSLEIIGDMVIYNSPIPCRLEISITKVKTFKEGQDEFISLQTNVDLYREAMHFPTVFPDEQLKTLLFGIVFDVLVDKYNDLAVLTMDINQKFI